jgi:spermidine synthase
MQARSADMILHLLLIGFVSILGQAVLLRELSVAFYGVDLIYALALGVWLIWTAFGAMIGRSVESPSMAGIERLFLCLAIILPADVVFIRAIRLVFSDVPGAYLPFLEQMTAMSAALLPAGLLSGMIFQWAARAFLAKGKTLAVAYALESLGGLAGGMSATLFLRFGARNFTIAVICALLTIVILALPRRGGSRGFMAIGVPAAAAIVILLWRSAPLDRIMTSWTHPGLQDSRDTPYGRITLTNREGQIAVYENDALSFETEGTEAEEFAQMAALNHPRPDQVLILGGGLGGTVGEILKHSPRHVDYVELNRDLWNMLMTHLPPRLREPMLADSLQVHFSDPRNFLGRSTNYDLMLIGMPEPDSGQTNRYYTAEFFRLCAGRLRKDGILAFRLKASENRWTPQQAARARSIYSSLEASLPEIRVLPGDAATFIASREPLPEDPDVLVARLEARHIKTRLLSPPYIRYAYRRDRLAQIAGLLNAADASPNTDTRPVCYPYTIMIWLSKFYPGLATEAFASLPSWIRWRNPLLWAALPALLMLFLFSRRRPHLRSALLAGIAGWIGMLLETVLVLHYQVRNALLFQDIGTLLMSFMAGLALGALVSDRWIPCNRGRTPHGFGHVLVIGMILLCLMTGAGIRYASLGGWAGTAGLLLATGFLVAAVFTYASVMGVGDQRRVVAPLYAADLIGGSLGSVAASLVLIPLAGMTATTAIAAVFALMAVPLL